jgi:glutathione S-transferase
MYRLFYADGSAAYSTRVILEEIGASYELIHTDITTGAARDPALLAVNPNGWVPVLLHDDVAMHEASAISIYLADRHPEAGLAPAFDSPARGAYLQWLVYFSNTLQMAYQLTYYWFRFCDGPEHRASAEAKSRERLQEIWDYIDRYLGDKPWMAGEQFSAADIHLHMLSTWLSPENGHPTMDRFPNAKRVADRVAQRPSVRKVYGLT